MLNFDIYIYNPFNEKTVFFETVQGKTKAITTVNRLRICGVNGAVFNWAMGAYLKREFFHNREFSL